MKKNQEKDPLELILSGESVEKVFNTKRGKFTMALPLPRDIREIEVEVASRLNGLPIDSFSKDTISNFRVYVTLDKIITNAPEWWENMDSSEECPDDDLIIELYRGYLQFYKSSQKGIARSKFRDNVKVGKTRNKTKNVDDGTFSGIAYGKENEGDDD